MSDAQLIRIEATLCGRFNPVFKEAPHANQGILESIRKVNLLVTLYQ